MEINSTDPNNKWLFDKIEILQEEVLRLRAEVKHLRKQLNLMPADEVFPPAVAGLNQHCAKIS